MSDINLVIKESENVTDVAKCITVCDAIANIIGSWDLTTTTTIEKCFHRCGVVDAVPLEDEEIEDIPSFEVPWVNFYSMMPYLVQNIHQFPQMVTIIQVTAWKPKELNVQSQMISQNL